MKCGNSTTNDYYTRWSLRLIYSPSPTAAQHMGRDSIMGYARGSVLHIAWNVRAYSLIPPTVGHTSAKAKAVSPLVPGSGFYVRTCTYPHLLLLEVHAWAAGIHLWDTYEATFLQL